MTWHFTIKNVQFTDFMFLKMFGPHAVGGEILDTARERITPYDKYAVVMKKGQIIVVHVPHEIKLSLFS